MRFYNIHTHTALQEENTVTIVNRIICETEVYEIPEQCFLSYGIHPWDISDVDKQWECLKKAITGKKVVAIGEAGLDKLSPCPLPLQVNIFQKQALLAAETGLPLIIHCVKAWDELLTIYKKIQPANKWVIHGFRGKEIQAKQLLKNGFTFSFGVHFHPESVQVAWPGSVFPETDASDNSIHSVYRNMASALDISLEEFACKIEENVLSAFPSLLQK